MVKVSIVSDNGGAGDVLLKTLEERRKVRKRKLTEPLIGGMSGDIVFQKYTLPSLENELKKISKKCAGAVFKLEMAIEDGKVEKRYFLDGIVQEVPFCLG